MNALDLITKRLNGNRGLAEGVIQLIEKYVDFNEIESEFAYDSNEDYWKEVCIGEISDISDRFTDNDWYTYHALDEYFENVEHSSGLNGLGDCLFLYMKCKKGLNESLNIKKNAIKINESQLRDIISKTIAEALEETTEYSLNESCDFDGIPMNIRSKITRPQRRYDRWVKRTNARDERRHEREDNDYSNQRKKEFYHLKMLIGDIMKYDETLLYYEPELKSAIENLYQWCQSHEEAYQNIIQWRKNKRQEAVEKSLEKSSKP